MEPEDLQNLLDKLLAANVGDTIEDADGNPFTVLRGRNGCRYVQLDADTKFMEQNKQKDSRFAKMAREGRKIGWVIPRRGRWRLVILKETKAEDEDDFEY